MNDLQAFLNEANDQTQAVIQEAFTRVGEAPAVTRYGTFGDPQIMPVSTRQGYQDYLVTPLKVRASQFANPAAAEAFARKEIIRTATGRTFFVQVVDFTEVVVYTFMLTDREL
jgi:hypothetical protein